MRRDKTKAISKLHWRIMADIDGRAEYYMSLRESRTYWCELSQTLYKQSSPVTALLEYRAAAKAGTFTRHLRRKRFTYTPQ